MFSDFLTYGHMASTITALGGILFFGWVLFKTRSWYLFKYFLWRVFHGKGNITDPTIKAYMGEQSSLMMFRFLVVNVATNQDAKELIEWSKEKNLNLQTVGRTGDYFDYATRKIRANVAKNLAKYRRVFAALCLFSMFGMMVSCAVLGTSRAIATFRASQQSLLLGSDSARAVFFLRLWKNLFVSDLTKAQCVLPGYGDVSSTGFSQADAEILCKAWPDPRTKVFVRTTVHQQRNAGGFLLLVLILTALKESLNIGKVEAAIKVHGRTKE